jgi:predicted Zn-dependent peptidase
VFYQGGNMEQNKLINNNGTYLYKDEGFNTFSITLNFLANTNNRSAAILDVLCNYLLRCNDIYKTDDDITLRKRELYDMSLNCYTDWYGSQKIFFVKADLVSMNVIGDDYSKDAFEFIRDMLNKPDFTNEKALEIAKRKIISYIDYYLDDYEQFAGIMYYQLVLNMKDREYDYSTNKEYIKDLINSITLEDLKKEYDSLMSNYISGLVFGNINEEHFNEFVKCMDLTPINKDLDYSMDLKITEGVIEVEKNCEQSYIYVTYDFTELTNAEVRLLDKILNSVLGLCYQTLREKYGLVYGSSAAMFFHEKKLYIYGITDFSKKEKFIEAADEIVNDLKDRVILEKYMLQAKEEVADDEYSLSENKRKLSGIINNRILKFFGDKDRDEVNKEIQEMTPEELMNKTKTLTRKNVFMVRSKTNE